MFQFKKKKASIYSLNTSIQAKILDEMIGFFLNMPQDELEEDEE